jgi:hypothetical protein
MVVGIMEEEEEAGTMVVDILEADTQDKISFT